MAIVDGVREVELPDNVDLKEVTTEQLDEIFRWAVQVRITVVKLHDALMEIGFDYEVTEDIAQVRRDDLDSMSALRQMWSERCDREDQESPEGTPWWMGSLAQTR